MKKYILKRIIKSIISIFVVVAIVIGMVFTMVDRNKVFNNDPTYNKLKGSERVIYQYSTLENLGYLDYRTMGEMCDASEIDNAACQIKDSDEQKKVIAEHESKGFKVQKVDDVYFAIRDFGAVELVTKYFKNMFVFDNPNRIQDDNNQALNQNRGYYFGTDHNGVPALMCTGCEYKYQVYFNGRFPFIHSNFLRLNFGNSYPAKQGIPTLDVITETQGPLKSYDLKYPTGLEQKGSEDLHSVKYKTNLTRLDRNKFTDNYADAKMFKQDPSMIGISYIFNIISLILVYLIALPAGVVMARNKGKFVDKLGIFYINLLYALPSLAFIFIMKYLGTFAGLPDKFPQLGPGNIRSYLLPIIILTISSTASLMTWIRRYMIDQSSADYVKFAKAKGLSKSEISSRHILKNAIIPIVTGIPGSIVLAIGGSVMTEAVFAIPGMGKMLPDAINMSNNNMVITLTFIFTALSIFSLLAGDILLTIVDPRISLNAKKGDI